MTFQSRLGFFSVSPLVGFSSFTQTTHVRPNAGKWYPTTYPASAATTVHPRYSAAHGRESLSRPLLNKILISYQRASFLRKNPTEQKNPHELEQIMKYLTAVGNSTS